MKNWFANSSQVYRLSHFFFGAIFVCMSLGNIIDLLNNNDLLTASDQCQSCLTNLTMQVSFHGWAYGNLSIAAKPYLLRLQNGQWQWQDTPLNQYDTIEAVAVDSSSAAWAVVRQYHDSAPDTYAMLHESVGIWQLVPDSLSLFQIKSFTMDTPTDGWATGCDINQACGIYHFDGKSWALSPTEGNAVYNSLSMISATDGWAVGQNGAIAHFTHGIWQPIPSPISENLNSIVMLSPTNGLAVGDMGTIVRFDGQKWSRSASLSGGRTLSSLVMFGPNEGWATEGIFTGFRKDGVRALAHFHDGLWSNVPLPIGPQFAAVAMVSSHEGWALGINVLSYSASNLILRGQGIVAHYSDGIWHISAIQRIPDPLWITLVRLTLGLFLAMGIILMIWLWVHTFTYPRGTPFNSWWERINLLGIIIYGGCTLISILEPVLYTTYQYQLLFNVVLIGAGGAILGLSALYGILFAFPEEKSVPPISANPVI